MNNNDEQVIAQTRKWIIDVVIGCNFCPFAAREIKKDSVHYQVSGTDDPEDAVQQLLHECARLDKHPVIETGFLIFPATFTEFDDYLDLVSFAENAMIEKGYEGIYQLASFHPDYIFAGAIADDAANYTNRSPYPMLHLLREESIEKVLEKYPDPEQIPDRNISFAQEKGLAYMKLLRDACF